MLLFPPREPKLEIVYWSWNWDKDTITKAQGLKASLLSFQTVLVFTATKNILDEIKLKSKLLHQSCRDGTKIFDLNYSFECDWLIELFDNKLLDNKLSDENLFNKKLAGESMGNKSF